MLKLLSTGKHRRASANLFSQWPSADVTKASSGTSKPEGCVS